MKTKHLAATSVQLSSRSVVIKKQHNTSVPCVRISITNRPLNQMLQAIPKGKKEKQASSVTHFKPPLKPVNRCAARQSVEQTLAVKAENERLILTNGAEHGRSGLSLVSH